MNEHPTWRRMDDSASDKKGPWQSVRRSLVGKATRISARSNRFLWGIAVAGVLAATMVAWPPNLAWRLGSNRRLIAEETQSLDTPAVKAAREQAKLLQEVFATTLDVIHERYFHGDRAAVPARAMEDVFHQLQRRRNIQARWIGVNARTMSLPHEPKDDFERAAAKAIREGKGEYEAVEGDFYRRALAIPLDGGCLSCHGTFGAETKSPRFAGLTLRIALDPAKAPGEPR